MGLDDELCRKARELHGWELKFAGDYRTHPQVEISEWVKVSEHPAIDIGIEIINGRPTYGFVDRNRQDFLVYQPFATVYPGRTQDYQEDLLRAALLHLHRDSSEKLAVITFPLSLRDFVRSYHLWLLQPENCEIINFPGGIIPIYREGTLDGITAVLNSLRIEDSPRE